MFNPVILAAVFVQVLITRASRLAGAIAGLVITTGVLLWGLWSYASGYQMLWFGVPLPQLVFVVLCGVWYGFDIRDLVRAIRASAALDKLLNGPLLQDPAVLAFYDATREAWSAGRVSGLGTQYRSEGSLDRDSFIRKYPPLEETALGVFFDDLGPKPGEFMVGLGNRAGGSEPGRFLLTNLRLLQRDGGSGEWWAVALADIDSFAYQGRSKKTLTLNLKSGDVVTFTALDMVPKEDFFSGLLALRDELAPAALPTADPGEEPPQATSSTST
jgi:hypothetical protein